MLGRLCGIYDSNRVTIEGHTDLAFSGDVAARFLAYGWNVQHVGDANDTEQLAQAIAIFRRTHDVPTLIIFESHIGFGAPHKHDTTSAHGEPLGAADIRLAKRSSGWPEKPQLRGAAAVGGVAGASGIIARSAGTARRSENGPCRVMTPWTRSMRCCAVVRVAVASVRTTR